MLFGQNLQTDPKLKQLLKQSGISINEAKKLAKDINANTNSSFSSRPDNEKSINNILPVDGEKVNETIKNRINLDKSVVPINLESDKNLFVNEYIDSELKISQLENKVIDDSFSKNRTLINFGSNIFRGDPELFQN